MNQNHKNNSLIIFENDQLMVINKPKNLLVHATSFNEENTLFNLIKNKIKVEEFPVEIRRIRAGILQRLDKNTNGLMVVAKTKLAYDSLTKQLENNELIRKYQVLVVGNFKDDSLLIDAPIKRSKQSGTKRVVSADSDALDAQTQIKVLDNLNNAALIECQLLTGRTHQIRCHCAYIKHPVWNDQLYGKVDQNIDSNYGQFLTSYYLRFYDPKTNYPHEFKIELDSVFNNQIKKLTK